MHELSLAQELIEQVCRAAVQENAVRVTQLVVVIGSYSGVDPGAFEFAFPLAAEYTLVAGAKLVIETTPLMARCNDCLAETFPELFHPVCSHCGSTKISFEGGREFLIRSMELEIP